MGGADEENSGDKKNEMKDEEKESDRVYRKPLRRKMPLDSDDSSLDMLALTTLDQPGTSSDAITDATRIRSVRSNSPPSYDFDLAELEPQLKKVRIRISEKGLSLETKTPSSPPLLPPPLKPTFHGDHHEDFSDFNPISSTGGSDVSSRSHEPKKKLQFPIKFNRSKIPDPTVKKAMAYLKRELRIGVDQPDPNASMGPPADPILMSPHAMVKHSLRCIKNRLNIVTDEPDQNSDPPLKTSSLPCYSLKDRVHPYLSIEDVIIELEKFIDSMPNTLTSEVLKAQLSMFQKRLKLPESLPIYNVIICDSDLELVRMLKRHDFHFRNAKNEWMEMGEGSHGGGGSDERS